MHVQLRACMPRCFTPILLAGPVGSIRNWQAIRVIHSATWLGHRAKVLIALGFETQCRHGPGWFFGFPKCSAGSKYANLAGAVQ